jgi:hypothetical protein
MNNELKIHNDFNILFRRKEGKYFSIKSKNFWMLSGIMFITFLAIGLANGSLEYLKKKMSDPFVNWVNVRVAYSDKDKIGKVTLDLNNEELKDKYLYDNVIGYYDFYSSFYNSKLKGCFQAKGRTINIENPILNQIYDNKNLIYGRKFRNDKDWGLIVTEEFLKLYNYDRDSPFVYNKLPIGNNEDIYIPIPIIAIVNDLPDLSLFATTPYFYSQRIESYNINPFNTLNEKKIVCFVKGDSQTGSNFKNTLEQLLRNNERLKAFDPFCSAISINNNSYHTGYDIVISFDPDLESYDELETVFKWLKNADELKHFSFYRNHHYSLSNKTKTDSFDAISINFNNLDNIRAFKNYLSVNHEIEIELSQIKAKENFNFVSKLTLIISLILIIFSILSISMFVSHIFKEHLDKIRSNLGTFKAFGLYDITLKRIYLQIIYTFITQAMLLSLFLSWIFGKINGIRYFISLFGLKIEDRETYFQLFNFTTGIAIFLIISISFLVLYSKATHILNESPGNLIYGRNEKEISIKRR